MEVALDHRELQQVATTETVLTTCLIIVSEQPVPAVRDGNIIFIV